MRRVCPPFGGFMTKMECYLQRGRAKHGDRFDPAGLAPAFTGYFNTGQRIEVTFGYGEVKRGTVAATSGWRPSFMLMLTRRAIGSSWLLSDKDNPTAVITARGKRLALPSAQLQEIKTVDSSSLRKGQGGCCEV